MDRSRHLIAPGIWADCGRAVWFEPEQTLAVADLHLGYNWVHRAQGQLLPLSSPEDTLPRLETIVAIYHPRHLVLMGDVVHKTLPLPALKREFEQLVSVLSKDRRLTIVLGNHDRALKKLAVGLSVEILMELRIGSNVLVHGDKAPLEDFEKCCVFMGHEHPAINLGDGVKSARYPCFLVSETVVILPAFSNWSSGSSYGNYPLMSPLARSARFDLALAILGQKILPVRLSGHPPK